MYVDAVRFASNTNPVWKVKIMIDPDHDASMTTIMLVWPGSKTRMKTFTNFKEAQAHAGEIMDIISGNTIDWVDAMSVIDPEDDDVDDYGFY
jgi:hypothetical protein